MAITGTGTGPFTITGTETTLNIYNYVVGQNSANASKNSDNTQFDFNCVFSVGNGSTATVWNSSEEAVRQDGSSFTITANATLNIGLSNPARGGSYWRWNQGNDAFSVAGTINAYASRLYAAGRVNSSNGAVGYFEECMIAFLDSFTNGDGVSNPNIQYVRCFIAGATAVTVKLGGTVSLTGTKISGAGYAFQPLNKPGGSPIYTVNDYVGQGNTNDAVPNKSGINSQLNIIGAFDGAGTPRTSLITAQHQTGNTVRLQWKYNLTSLFNNAGQSGTNVRIRNLNNTVVYTGQTDANGKIPEQILTRFEYINSSTGTARFPYQVILRKYDRTSQALVYNADNHTTQQAVHIAVPYLTLTEAQALALTGVTITPSGATGGTVAVSGVRTIAELWQYYRAWIAQTANFDSEDTWTYDGTNLNIGAWTIIGIEFLTGGTITTITSTANGTTSNLSIIGSVTQATPTNLNGVIVTGTLTYNTNSNTTITITNTTINTVENIGTGIITINKVNSTITNYVDAEINFIDSSISVIGADTITIHPTANDRDLNQNVSATFTSTYLFKYGSLVNGSTMSGTLYLRCVSGTIPFNLDVNIIIGDNVEDLGMTALLSSLGTKIDTKPTLAQIEASSVLAKKSQVDIVNRNTIKASKLIPASENL